MTASLRPVSEQVSEIIHRRDGSDTESERALAFGKCSSAHPIVYVPMDRIERKESFQPRRQRALPFGLACQ